MTNCPNCDHNHTLNLNGYAWCRRCGALITLTNSGHVRRFQAPSCPHPQPTPTEFTPIREAACTKT